MVGAQDAGAGVFEDAEDARVGVAVVVSGADRDERDAGVDGFQEGRALVGRAVVGDFEDVGVEWGSGVEEGVLSGLLQVSGEQDRDAGPGGAQDE
ncbi:hypothetical protein HNR73_001893 [Phytomonospora endophytica]|uniref:Uncharacterized protein n=1 Tax=Phytomonospora endophytica TaxID=714109 RepID=A0A841FGC4_9ACTN|nr:hypothetical protein [Phytomonospora endophytica]MBB6034043.1 hypothetical protein [Phytomonospora endophytica]GIG71580.1 hypothetical protein Pen01_78750 [Phytomonospora endophytica]